MKSVRQILRDHDIQPVKRLGQSFLIDTNVMEKIVEIADIGADENIVEIGSGLGVMTAMIARRAAHVTAVEIDGNLIPILREQLEGCGNVDVVQKDILDYEFMAEKGKEPLQKLKVVGNIPYSISSPILFHLLDWRKNLSVAVLMMQREVADRLCAVPGTKAYGIPTVLFGLYSRIYRELSVPPSCFFPKPEVISSVVKMVLFEEPLYPLRNQALFVRLVKAAFSHRRKTLFNNLKSRPWQGCDDRRIRDFLINLGIGEKVRAEELSIRQFAELSNAFSDA